MNESKYYGVSTGDGNNGVSHMFPNYIVKTDDPFKLAELAARSDFKPDMETQQWVSDNMEIWGEEEHTISVVFHESKETQDEEDKLRSAVEVLSEYVDRHLAQKLERIIEDFGSDLDWFILEVFPIEESDPEKHYQCPIYESIEEAGI